MEILKGYLKYTKWAEPSEMGPQSVSTIINQSQASPNFSLNKNKMHADKISSVFTLGLSDGMSTKAQGSTRFDATNANGMLLSTEFSNVGFCYNASYTGTQTADKSNIEDLLNPSKYMLTDKSILSTRKSYKSITHQPRLKKVQHYSDVRTAFRKYNDILKQGGISLEKSVASKRNTRSVLQNVAEEKLVVDIKSKEKSLKQDILDAIADSEKIVPSKENIGLEVCIVIPEFYTSPEDLGRYSFRFDLLPHWRKYNKIFQNTSNVQYFLDLLEELKSKGKISSFHSILEIYDQQREYNLRSTDDLPSQASIQNMVDHMKEQGFDDELLRYIVTVYAQSIQLDYLSLDAMQEDITVKLRVTHDKEYRIDSLMFLNGEQVETILDVSSNTKVLFAGQKCNLAIKMASMVESIQRHNEQQSINLILSKVKTSWHHNITDKTLMSPTLPKLPKEDKIERDSSIPTTRDRSLNSVKARCFSNSFNGIRDKQILSKKENSSKNKDSRVDQTMNNHYFQPYVPGRQHRVQSRHLDNNSIVKASKAQSFDLGRSDQTKTKILDTNLSLIKTRNQILLPKIRHASAMKSNIRREEKYSHLNNSLLENESQISSSFQLNKNSNINICSIEKISSQRRASTIQVPDSEYYRIRREYTELEKADLHEIYSHFILLGGVSERRKILDQKRKYEEINKRSNSVAAKQLKSQDKNWAITKVMLNKCSEEFRIDQLSIESSVSVDVLIEYDEFLQNKSPKMREKILIATQVMSESLGQIHWENFLNFYTVVIKGKGNPEQQKTFLVRLLFPNDEEMVTKESVLEILQEILETNRILKGRLRNVHESSELIWARDFEGAGCAENGYLVHKKLKESLRNNQTSSESFLKLLNDQIGMLIGEFSDDDDENN